jgi:hypothetical protein
LPLTENKIDALIFSFYFLEEFDHGCKIIVTYRRLAISGFIQRQRATDDH